MTMYDLPTSLTVGGVEYKIRSDFRAVIDVLVAMNDPELNEQGRATVILKIMYPDWREIPAEFLQEAVQKASEFIDCGQKGDGRKRPRMIDWEQDAPLIIPAVNSVAHKEVRAIPDLHWWTFFGWFMEIGESVFSNVIRIRGQKSRGKKLDKAEQEWYRQNRHLVDFHQTYTDSENEILKEWGIK